MDAADDRHSPDSITRALARVLSEGSVAALATVVSPPRDETSTHHDDAPATRRDASTPTRTCVGAKILTDEAGARSGTTGDVALDELISAHSKKFLDSRAEARTYRVEEFAPALSDWSGARVMFERVEPEPHVVVCGAGHVGAALARLAAALGYRVTLIDDRADFVAPERFAGVGVRLVAARNWTDPVRAAVGAGRGVSVAVVTRGHNEDEECMRAVLSARPDYVGMIGSRRRTNIVLARLREDGFAEELLREVRAPVGLDIGSVSPGEVALSILAEMVAHRRGGTGRPLSAWRRE